MADKLDERSPHGAPHVTVRRDDVAEGEEREQHADPDDLDHLEQHVLAAEAGQALIPDGRQQLLHVRVRDELSKKESSLVGCEYTYTEELRRYTVVASWVEIDSLLSARRCFMP